MPEAREAREEREIDPSAGQRLLWFLDRYRGHDGALNCPMMCRIRGPLETEVLRRCLETVVSRHESLRTVFRGGGRHLRGIVRASAPVDLDLRRLDGSPDPERALREAVAEELATRIDPVRSGFRTTLWRVADDDHVLCLNMHHLVTDSWSCGVVFQDLCALLGEAGGDGDGTPAPGMPFSEFAAWQRAALDGGALRAQQEYWQQRLAGLTLAPLPVRDVPGERSTALVRRELDRATVDGLREAARAGGSTLFSLLLTLYYGVLHRATGRTDLAVASLYANRTRPELRRTVGFLANMVVLRTRFDPAAGVLDALRATHATVTGAFLNQGVPYQLLPLREAQSQGARADDIVFQMLAEPVYSTTAGGLALEVLVPDGVGSRFELELVLVPHGEGFHVLLFYNEGRLDEKFATELAERYVTAAERVSRDTGLSFGRVC
ncbi:condensation domain-containing protein [Streptomyces capoamus]|uniref:condensation domain-containing protein n=1 Tax=Streptomyces capoamus TaxID=68183 RepID=UPI001E2C3ED9|nr:condensation domain-containing protein [Streptomyces capoamus]